jgi:Holliday junction resolvase
MSEAKLQAAIREKLEAKGYMVVKLIKTSCNGIPDLMCLKHGKVYFIEVKTPVGVVSELQKYRIEQIEKQGFLVFVVRDIKDLII